MNKAINIFYVVIVATAFILSCQNRYNKNSKPASSYKWEKVTLNAAFTPRGGAGALVYKDKMWLIGGWNSLKKDNKYFPRKCNNEVWSSSDGLNWIRNKPNTFIDDSFDSEKDWEGRHKAGYVVFKNKMWIVGGDQVQGHYQNDIWNSDDGKNWKLINSHVPWNSRVLHHTLVFKNKIWVMGGQTFPQAMNSNKEALFFNDIWNSADGVNWQKIQTKGLIWSPRGLISGFAVFDGKMWMLGGGTARTPKHQKPNYYNDVWNSEDGVHWHQVLKNAPWIERYYHNVAVFDNKLWVLDGEQKKGNSRSEKDIKDVWYSEDGITWNELPNTPWIQRHSASVFVYDNGLWIITGSNMESDVWKLVKTDNKKYL